MDLQQLINNMNESGARTRGNYHLTYGELIEALKKAPKDTLVDERIKGIGSWRGSYIEIAIFSKDKGLHAEKCEFNDYGGNNIDKKYKAWEKENTINYEELPRTAGELAVLLESLIGLEFVGWKGGNFKIEEYKPLWLCEEAGYSGNTAIVGISEDLKLITKEL